MLKHLELRAAPSIFPGEIPVRITQPCDLDAPALIAHVEYMDLLFGPPGVATYLRLTHILADMHSRTSFH